MDPPIDILLVRGAEMGRYARGGFWMDVLRDADLREMGIAQMHRPEDGMRPL